MKYIQIFETFNPEDPRIQEFIRYTRMFIGSSNASKYIKQNMEIFIEAGIPKEDLLDSIHDIVLEWFEKYVKMMIGSTDNTRFIKNKLDDFINLGFNGDELITRAIPIIDQGFIDYTNMMLKGSNGPFYVKLKINSWNKDLGIEGSHLKGLIEDLVIEGMDRYIKMMINSISPFVYIKRKLGELLELVNTPNRLMDSFYDILFDEYLKLPQYRKDIIDKSEYIIIGGIRKGFLMDYKELLAKYPSIEITPEELDKANKLTKAYKLLKRK